MGWKTCLDRKFSGVLASQEFGMELVAARETFKYFFTKITNPLGWTQILVRLTLFLRIDRHVAITKKG